LKSEPFANLESLRHNFLFEIKKNYISTGQLINKASKQYIFHTNHAAEEVSSIIQKFIPIYFPSSKLDINSPTVTKVYEKLFMWHDDPDYDMFKEDIGVIFLNLKP
jgi:hypothetical protein